MEKGVVKAVIYCRCSTEEESQRMALLQQVRESRESVERHGWLLVDEYIESASGTTVKKRDEYQRLYEDMMTDKFDIIQIKSQDRLMRNTKDWYLFLDRLVTNGKKLFIYIENRFYSTDDSLITGIRAILAENYSRELSVKLNNAHRQRQKQGKVLILPPDTRGYRKLSRDQVIVDEEEAEAIRRMFQLVMEGMGSRTCAWLLLQQGKKDHRGRYYDEQSIRRIIRNPLYCGTVVQNKVHYNFETKKYEPVPREQWVVHENAVPAIVSKDVWQAANQAMDRRVNDHQRGKNTGKYDLSGKIICGLCGRPYYRAFRRRYKNGELLVEWKCSTYLKYGRKDSHTMRPQLCKVQADQARKGCENIHLDERRLYGWLDEFCGQCGASSPMHAEVLRDQTLHILEKVFDQDKALRKLEKLNKELENLRQLKSRLLDKLLQSVISDSDFQAKKAELEKRIQSLSEEKDAIGHTQAAKAMTKQRLDDIRACLEKGVIQKAAVLTLIEQIEKIVVYPEKLELHLKMDLSSTSRGERAFSNVKIIGPVDEKLSSKRQKMKAMEDIVAMMKDDPHITARQIASIQGISLSAANGRLGRLKKAGRIRFHGRGGKGVWEVLD